MSTVAPVQGGVQPAPGEWTYEDYLNLPDDGRRYEIIDGTLYVTEPRSVRHQLVLGEILGEIHQFLRTHKLGHMLIAPFEIHLSERTRPVQPDLFYIKLERCPKSNVPFFEGAPDLIVEILSPDTAKVDRFIKPKAYAEAGVTEYWIANPNARTVEVFSLSEGEYVSLGEFKDDEVIRSVVLEGLAIVTSTLFNPVYQ